MWRTDRRAWRVAALCLAVAGPASAMELSELMSQRAQQTSGEARFTEQRFVSSLDQPLNFSGTLSFSAPDRLARLTQLPRAESFVVDGDNVTIERGGRVRHLALEAAPEMAALVAALRGILNGDAALLQKHFQPTLSGSLAQWTLTLVPRDSRLATALRQLRLEGRNADLRLVEVQLSDGDRSVMTIEPMAPAKPRPRTP